MCNCSNTGFNPFMMVPYGQSYSSGGQANFGGSIFPGQGTPDPLMMMMMSMMGENENTSDSMIMMILMSMMGGCQGNPLMMMFFSLLGGTCNKVESENKKMDVGTALDLIIENFDQVQNARNGEKDKDGLMGNGDLKAIAKNKDGKYSPELVEAAKVLLDNPKLLEDLDTAKNPKGTPDEIISKEDLEEFKKDHPYLFEKNDEYGDDQCQDQFAGIPPFILAMMQMFGLVN